LLRLLRRFRNRSTERTRRCDVGLSASRLTSVLDLSFNLILIADIRSGESRFLHAIFVLTHNAASPSLVQSRVKRHSHGASHERRPASHSASEQSSYQ
jgi:hypothetical protein